MKTIGGLIPSHQERKKDGKLVRIASEKDESGIKVGSGKNERMVLF